MFQIAKIISQDSKVVRDLKNERAIFKQQMLKTPMKENYVEYVKLERQLQNIEIKIEAEKKNEFFKQYSTIGVNYAIKFLLGLSLFIIIIFNRRQPVIVFSEKFNFAPFSGIISYPSSVENSISLPFWVFINNYVFRQLAGRLIK